MDLSCYFDEQYAALVKDIPVQNNLSPVDSKKEENTSDDNLESVLHDFEIEKVFIGKFNGPGRDLNYNDKKIATWSFTDMAGKTWLIPRWLIMDVPQGTFRGFSKELPSDNFIYYLEYLEFVPTKNNGGTHNIKIFRKYA